MCATCTFGFYKKSDLTKHERTCKGVKHHCTKCQQVFHFKRQLHEHCLWSSTCGAMRDKAPPSMPPEGSDRLRYLDEGHKASMVRLNVTQHQSVVGINCQELIDPEVFDKKKKRARCGLCDGCSREEDCGTCSKCRCKDVRGKSSACDRKKCMNLLEQYSLRKGKTCDLIMSVAVEEALATNQSSDWGQNNGDYGLEQLEPLDDHRESKDVKPSVSAE